MKTITRNVRRKMVAAATVILMLAGMLFSNIFPATEFVSAATKKSEAPAQDCITVTNNAEGTSDIVYVRGLSPKDLVQVYSEASKGKALAKKTVSSSGADATLKIKQLGAGAGKVYVSVTGKDCSESSRTEVAYDAEQVSAAPADGSITVINNAGTSDTVNVNGLKGKDLVQVYDAATDGKLLKRKTVSSSGSDVTIKIKQLGTTTGYVYVSVTSKCYNESARKAANYGGEPLSTLPVTGNITVVNNAGTSDTVNVSGLQGKDLVKVYDAATGGNLLGKKNVSSSGSDATIKIKQLGATAGSVYVSVTNKYCTESARVEAAYADESVSEYLHTSLITVTNNAGESDTVYVSGLNGKDIVKVYSELTGGKLLGQKTVSSSGSDVTIKIAQLGTTEGIVFVSVTNPGCNESGRTEAPYEAEQPSTPPDVSNITVVNNADGDSDTVYVGGLSGKDIVKVYNAAGKLLGQKGISTSGSDVTVKIAQLGATAGSVYVSVTNSGCTESEKVEAAYDDEPATAPPDAANITVTNNAVGTSDTVNVGGLSGKDIVKVYKAPTGGNPLGQKTVSSSGSDVTINISQLGTGAGSVYVSVTSPGYNESARTEAAYDAEPSSTPPVAENITVTNVAGTQDTVDVSGLEEGDLIKVYDADGNLLGKATASSDGSATVTLELAASGGTIYVTVKTEGKLESGATDVNYAAEV